MSQYEVSFPSLVIFLEVIALKASQVSYPSNHAVMVKAVVFPVHGMSQGSFISQKGSPSFSDKSFLAASCNCIPSSCVAVIHRLAR